jgi:hypothetical protein
MTSCAVRASRQRDVRRADSYGQRHASMTLEHNRRNSRRFGSPALLMVGERQPRCPRPCTHYTTTRPHACAAVILGDNFWPQCARHTHQRPHVLQKCPGFVAEARRPQRAAIDLLCRARQPRAGQHPPSCRAAHPRGGHHCGAGCAACSLPAVAPPYRCCPPHRASLPGYALKIAEAAPPTARSK